MAMIPQEVQEFMQGKVAWVATASPEGVPNATPKGTVRVIDDEHLVFADLFSRKTRENLLKNPRVAVTVIDEKSRKGFQIKGTVELLTAGELFTQVAEELQKAPQQLTYVVKITVDAVFDQSVGPDAGKQIA
jgi:predicted pyridoxine 5'-phosphate oxidase superfamily flavin-nucleotide-binding protein